MNNFKEDEIFKAFEEGLNEALEKLPPEEREAWNNATPAQVAYIVWMHLINPLNWIKVFFAAIVGIFKGIFRIIFR